MTLTIEERFWAKVNFAGPIADYSPQLGACWLWTGARWQNGYGMFYLDGRQVGAHRTAYRLLVGEIPVGLVIDHLCRIHRCVNVSHLEAVTVLENTRRGVTADVASARHAARTHFSCGCPLEGNTTTSKQGTRSCTRCLREYRRVYYQEHRKPKRQSHPREAITHCVNGHLLNGENLRLTKSGSRACIECAQRRSREYMRRKRGHKATVCSVSV